MLTNDETEYLVAAATAGCDHVMSEQVEQIEDGIRSHVIRQPHLVVSLALLSVLRRKHERAIALYRLMLDLMPDEWRLRALLARIHYDLGEPQWKVEIGRVLRQGQDPSCLSTVRSLFSLIMMRQGSGWREILERLQAVGEDEEIRRAAIESLETVDA